jgi:hypothetical protein
MRSDGAKTKSTDAKADGTTCDACKNELASIANISIIGAIEKIILGQHALGIRKLGA